MKKNLMILVISLFGLISLNFRCGREYPPPETDKKPIHYFEMPLGFYPVKKNYSIGDTIWIEANVSDKMLMDMSKLARASIDSTKFNVPITYHVVNKQVLVPAGGFCEFINPDQLKLSTSDGYYDSKYNVYWNYNTAAIVNFGCGISTLKFKIGLKLKAKGDFYVGLAQSGLTACEQKITPIAQSLVSFKFDVTDVNLDVYNEMPKLEQTNPYWTGFDEQKLYQRKAIVVKVI